MVKPGSENGTQKVSISHSTVPKLRVGLVSVVHPVVV